jgi:hypothetical protein
VSQNEIISRDTIFEKDIGPVEEKYEIPSGFLIDINQTYFLMGYKDKMQYILKTEGNFQFIKIKNDII